MNMVGKIPTSRTPLSMEMMQLYDKTTPVYKRWLTHYVFTRPQGPGTMALFTLLGREGRYTVAQKLAQGSELTHLDS